MHPGKDCARLTELNTQLEIRGVTVEPWCFYCWQWSQVHFSVWSRLCCWSGEKHSYWIFDFENVSLQRIKFCMQIKGGARRLWLLTSRLDLQMKTLLREPSVAPGGSVHLSDPQWTSQGSKKDRITRWNKQQRKVLLSTVLIRYSGCSQCNS